MPLFRKKSNLKDQTISWPVSSPQHEDAPLPSLPPTPKTPKTPKRDRLSLCNLRARYNLGGDSSPSKGSASASSSPDKKARATPLPRPSTSRASVAPQWVTDALATQHPSSNTTPEWLRQALASAGTSLPAPTPSTRTTTTYEEQRPLAPAAGSSSSGTRWKPSQHITPSSSMDSWSGNRNDPDAFPQGRNDLSRGGTSMTPQGTQSSQGRSTTGGSLNGRSTSSVGRSRSHSYRKPPPHIFGTGTSSVIRAVASQPDMNLEYADTSDIFRENVWATSAGRQAVEFDFLHPDDACDDVQYGPFDQLPLAPAQGGHGAEEDVTLTTPTTPRRVERRMSIQSVRTTPQFHLPLLTMQDADLDPDPVETEVRPLVLPTETRTTDVGIVSSSSPHRPPRSSLRCPASPGKMKAKDFRASLTRRSSVSFTESSKLSPMLPEVPKLSPMNMDAGPSMPTERSSLAERRSSSGMTIRPNRRLSISTGTAPDRRLSISTGTAPHRRLSISTSTAPDRRLSISTGTTGDRRLSIGTGTGTETIADRRSSIGLGLALDRRPSIGTGIVSDRRLSIGMGSAPGQHQNINTGVERVLRTQPRLNLMVVGGAHTGKTCYIRALVESLRLDGDERDRQIRRFGLGKGKHGGLRRTMTIEAMPPITVSLHDLTSVTRDDEEEVETSHPRSQETMLLSLIDTPSLPPSTSLSTSSTEPASPLKDIINEVTSRYSGTLTERSQSAGVHLEDSTEQHVNLVLLFIDPREVLEGNWWYEGYAERRQKRKDEAMERKKEKAKVADRPRKTESMVALRVAQFDPQRAAAVTPPSAVEDDDEVPEKKHMRVKSDSYSVSAERRESDAPPLPPTSSLEAYRRIAARRSTSLKLPNFEDSRGEVDQQQDTAEPFMSLEQPGVDPILRPSAFAKVGPLSSSSSSSSPFARLQRDPFSPVSTTSASPVALETTKSPRGSISTDLPVFTRRGSISRSGQDRIRFSTSVKDLVQDWNLRNGPRSTEQGTKTAFGGIPKSISMPLGQMQVYAGFEATNHGQAAEKQEPQDNDDDDDDKDDEEEDEEDVYVPTLPPMSRRALQELLPLVPVLPIISRSDTLTIRELHVVRVAVQRGWEQVRRELDNCTEGTQVSDGEGKGIMSWDYFRTVDSIPSISHGGLSSSVSTPLGGTVGSRGWGDFSVGNSLQLHTADSAPWLAAAAPPAAPAASPRRPSQSRRLSSRSQLSLQEHQGIQGDDGIVIFTPSANSSRRGSVMLASSDRGLGLQGQASSSVGSSRRNSVQWLSVPRGSVALAMGDSASCYSEPSRPASVVDDEGEEDSEEASPASIFDSASLPVSPLRALVDHGSRGADHYFADKASHGRNRSGSASSSGHVVGLLDEITDDVVTLKSVSAHRLAQLSPAYSEEAMASANSPTTSSGSSSASLAGEDRSGQAKMAIPRKPSRAEVGYSASYLNCNPTPPTPLSTLASPSLPIRQPFTPATPAPTTAAATTASAAATATATAKRTRSTATAWPLALFAAEAHTFRSYFDSTLPTSTSTSSTSSPSSPPKKTKTKAEKENIKKVKAEADNSPIHLSRTYGHGGPALRVADPNQSDFMTLFHLLFSSSSASSSGTTRPSEGGTGTGMGMANAQTRPSSSSPTSTSTSSSSSSSAAAAGQESPASGPGSVRDKIWAASQRRYVHWCTLPPREGQEQEKEKNGEAQG